MAHTHRVSLLATRAYFNPATLYSVFDESMRREQRTIYPPLLDKCFRTYGCTIKCRVEVWISRRQEGDIMHQRISELLKALVDDWLMAHVNDAIEEWVVQQLVQCKEGEEEDSVDEDSSVWVKKRVKESNEDQKGRGGTMTRCGPGRRF